MYARAARRRAYAEGKLVLSGDGSQVDDGGGKTDKTDT